MPDVDTSQVTAIARAGAFDRYLAALLAPASQRDALLALAAFSAELSRIPLAVHEPAMGDIRLQWWRDALELPAELRAGHPVADAIRAAARRHALPTDLLEALIDGRALLLGDTMPRSDEGLRDLLWKTEGALFALGARVVGVPATPELDATCAASGYAYGLASSVQSGGPLPPAQFFEDEAGAAGTGLREEHFAQIRSNLAAARQFTATLPRVARIAFLPLALVEPYLRGLQRSGSAPSRGGVHIGPLGRVCRIAGAHLTGRF